MSFVALITVVMIILGAIAKAFPAFIRDMMIYLCYGVGIILLLPTPLMIIAVAGPVPELKVWLDSFGATKMILWGIPVVFVGSLFMQAWLSENSPGG